MNLMQYTLAARSKSSVSDWLMLLSSLNSISHSSLSVSVRFICLFKIVYVKLLYTTQCKFVILKSGYVNIQK